MVTKSAIGGLLSVTAEYDSRSLEPDHELDPSLEGDVGHQVPRIGVRGRRRRRRLDIVKLTTCECERIGRL
jgi:hypothetical protein